MKKILVVDDSSTVRMRMREVLGKQGYDTIFARDEVTLYEKLESEYPDLIILDIVMPKTDGYEICKKLKNNDKTKDIPVIFLTAQTDDEAFVKGFEAGANDFITKSVNEKILKARINAQLEAVEIKRKLIESEKNAVLLAAKITAHHEINQPLTVISGHIELLDKKLKQEKGIDYEKINKHIESIMNSISRISEIIKKFAEIKEVKLTKYVGESKMLELD